MYPIKIYSKAAVCVLLVGSVLVACKKNLTQSSSVNDADVTKPRTILSSITQDFDSYADGTNYTSAFYANDFGNQQHTTWSATRAIISNPGGDASLKIMLPANEFGSDNSGDIALADISDGTEYQVKFDFKFSSGFDCGLGGKLGWGFGFGNIVTSCHAPEARAGQGGSCRLMWNKVNGVWKIKPYMYYKGMTQAQCGGESNYYPIAANDPIIANTWYTAVMKLKSNSGTNGVADGHAYITIQKGSETPVVLLNRNMEWGANNYSKTISHLMFDTFRGGDTATWASPLPGAIYYNKMMMTKIN